MVVTLEPCAMCAGALVNARVERLVFGAYDPKAGFCGSLGNLVQDARLNHRLEVEGGFMEERSRELLQAFLPAAAQARTRNGEVAEWLNAAVSKTVIPSRVSGVRIPPSPPFGARTNSHATRRDGRVA